MSEKDRAAESRSLCRRLVELLPDDPVVICAYMPMSDEVDIKPLLQDLLDRKYSIFMPRYEGGKLTFRKVEDLSILSPGSFDIPEPPITAPEIDHQNVSHVFVPGRAYDLSRNRLGRGNGGYDHWIRNHRTKNQNTTFLGVCYECQVVQEVPVEGHDERVDAIITARGLLEIES